MIFCALLALTRWKYSAILDTRYVYSDIPKHPGLGRLNRSPSAIELGNLKIYSLPDRAAWKSVFDDWGSPKAVTTNPSPDWSSKISLPAREDSKVVSTSSRARINPRTSS
jgi:hypothetical protein